MRMLNIGPKHNRIVQMIHNNIIINQWQAFIQRMIYAIIYWLTEWMNEWMVSYCNILKFVNSIKIKGIVFIKCKIVNTAPNKKGTNEFQERWYYDFIFFVHRQQHDAGDQVCRRKVWLWFVPLPRQELGRQFVTVGRRFRRNFGFQHEQISHRCASGCRNSLIKFSCLKVCHCRGNTSNISLLRIKGCVVNFDCDVFFGSAMWIATTWNDLKRWFGEFQCTSQLE